MANLNEKEKSKRNFDFKMSKKVAELTQVVHMLFTRNHEKEVEIEALKDAYECEINDVIADARNRIAQLEGHLQETMNQQEEEKNRMRKVIEGEFQQQELDSRRRVEEVEKLLQEERTECQNLRDMLIRAQRDIENLRHGVTQQISSQADEVTRRDREIERLKKHIITLEQSLKDCGKESSELIKELEKSNENLERELRHVHAALEESHRARDQLLVRNKQLEADLKALKRDFNRKVSEVVNGQKVQRGSVDFTQDTNEELERLRREIQRYRLELSNRDANFNRMFTEKQPIHVDRGSGGFKLNSASYTAGAMHQANGMNNIMALRREKTVGRLPSGNSVICFDNNSEQQRNRSGSTPSSHMEARDSRFPSISSTPENKSRPIHSSSRLTKPKPLPKEMLYGK